MPLPQADRLIKLLSNLMSTAFGSEGLFMATVYTTGTYVNAIVLSAGYIFYLSHSN